MCLTTVSYLRYMIFEFYIKQSMQMVELKKNMIIDENSHLINVLDKSVNQPYSRKYSSLV